MNFLKNNGWQLAGVASVALVAWLGHAVLIQPATALNLLGSLFIAWLCTPKHQYRTGSWLVWFAVWWLALGMFTREDGNSLLDGWVEGGGFGLLLVVTAVRMMKVLSLDAKDDMRKGSEAGKTA
jgi:hypothetical protein